MVDTPQSQLVAEIARDVVGQIAPHELPLFRATSEAYFRRAARSLKTQGARDEMLGFGTGKDVAFLTPVVLVVTTEVVEFVAASLKMSTAAGDGSPIVEQVRSTFRRYRLPETVDQQPVLTSAQIAQARQRALQKACQLKLAEAQAQILADALADTLVSTSS